MFCRTQRWIHGFNLGLNDQAIEMQDQYLSLLAPLMEKGNRNEH